MIAISAGKMRGIDAVADRNGVIRAAAMDQRGSLSKAIAQAKKVEPEAITAQMMAEFKTAVIRILSPHASGVLLDPEFGLEASKARDRDCGLLLAYEQSGYDNTTPGRIPVLLPDWTVRQLLDAGAADCIKVLLYYSPLEEGSINERKRNWVERIGAECGFHDVPFFLEFVTYDPNGNEKSAEYARRKPQLVAETMAEFSKDFYQVDVLKVEIPVDLQFTSGTRSFKGEAAYSRREAKELFQRAAESASRPFIYLSAGVSNAQFLESVELALESELNFAGVLCGRATWKEGIPVYAEKGLGALEDWLEQEGVKNIEALNHLLQNAHSWRDFYEARIRTS